MSAYTGKLKFQDFKVIIQFLTAFTCIDASRVWRVHSKCTLYTHVKAEGWLVISFHTRRAKPNCWFCPWTTDWNEGSSVLIVLLHKYYPHTCVFSISILTTFSFVYGTRWLSDVVALTTCTVLVTSYILKCVCFTNYTKLIFKVSFLTNWNVPNNILEIFTTVITIEM